MELYLFTVNDNLLLQYEGLWLKCTAFGTGNWDCDDFNRFFLGLPTELQAGNNAYETIFHYMNPLVTLDILADGVILPHVAFK